jgi:RNA polymerase sigma-70 factor (ECF subfamily)
MQEALHILKGFQERDVKAVKQLFESVFIPLRFLAERITNDENEAIDIAMNTIARLWEQDLSELQKIENLMGYLKKAVENASLDYLRKQKSKKNYQHHVIYTEGTTEEFLIERAFYEAEVMTVIYKEVEKLPEKTREVFKRVYLQKISRVDVATQLQMSISTVHVHCSKAINDLRKVISEKELLLILVLLNLYNDN